MRRPNTATYLILCVSVCVCLPEDPRPGDAPPVDTAPVQRDPVSPARRCRGQQQCVPADTCKIYGDLQDALTTLLPKTTQGYSGLKSLIDDLTCDENKNLFCCDPDPCEWGPWSPCSVTCGNGTGSHFRTWKSEPKPCKEPERNYQFEPCSVSTNCPEPPPPGDEVILQGPMDDFTQSIYLRLLESEGDNNFVFSPLSLHTALSMLYLGTTTGSQTEKEFNQIMGDASDKTLLKNGYKVVIGSYTNLSSFVYGNKFWVQTGTNLNSKFEETVVDIFKSGIDNIDFAANNSVDIVNDWVRTLTRGKIEKLAEDFSPDTQLYLANALYFKEGWKEPFEVTNLSETGPLESPFEFLNSSAIDIPMIRQTFSVHGEDAVTYSEIFNDTDKVQVVSIPYKNDQFEMQIISPNSRQAMTNLVDRMKEGNKQQSDNPFNLFSHPKNDDRFHNERSEIDLWMPTFQAKSDLDVVNLLKQLGVKNVFTNTAELGELTEGSNLRVSSVHHTAVVEVTKDGTEAAAATDLGFTELSGTQFSFTRLRVNGPFIFVIRDKLNKIPVLVGRVVDPTKKIP